MRRLVAALVFSALGLSLHAAEPVFTKEGLALSGYDAVAYFTDGKPVEGRASYEAEWKGVRWRFASAAHRDAFQADPGKYAPQFGGFCAFGVSRGYAVDADPFAWKIVEGRLYVNHDKKVQQLWEKELPTIIGAAEARWPNVERK